MRRGVRGSCARCSCAPIRTSPGLPPARSASCCAANAWCGGAPPRRPGASSPLDTTLTIASTPNAVWTVDFKGEFRLASGPYCFPLTVMDAQSRFLLGCTALLSTATMPTQVVFTRLFQRYGLPQVIRSDNGVPFAAALALGRLSSLAVWWIRLGIRPERIAPGQPQQNGAHERMHVP